MEAPAPAPRPPTSGRPISPSRVDRLLAVGFVTVQVAAQWQPKLALVALLLLLLAFLGWPPWPPAGRWRRSALLIASVAAAISALRFSLTIVPRGILAGGAAGEEKSAVARLQELRLAEHEAQRVLGERGLPPRPVTIGELLGRGPLVLPFPLLERGFGLLPGQPETARSQGFLLRLCPPTKAWGNHPLGPQSYRAYAWPAADAPLLERAFVLDGESRQILVGSPKRFSGLQAPDCDDLVATPSAWKPW